MDSGSSSGFNRKTSLNSDFLRWMKSTCTGSKISHHQQSLFSQGDDDDDDAGPTNKTAFGGGTTPPAGGGVALAGYPFTGAQWKELERQAMIYKCMISCVPVPPHLLFPLDSSFPCGRKGDPEPGRCKRTDGKKWRCSREVAPQQKYCERHLHRGRPRSRKPVEPNNSKKNKTPPAPPKTDKESLQLQPYMGGFGPLQEDLNLFSYPEMDLLSVESERDVWPSLAMQIESKWVSPVSWERGGPLAEALSPATTVSSPSGTLFSYSDGSVCNSPTATFWV